MLYTFRKITEEKSMAWKNSCIKDEKLMFISDWLKKEFTHTVLCARYGISRPTGYLLINRYMKEREGAFNERSREPHNIPHKTSYKIEKYLLTLKYRYPKWGPAKIRDFLIAEKIKGKWPAASTIGELFKRHGLVKKRRLRKKVAAHSEPLKHCHGPNAVWSADFKGQFHLKNGRYCYPLTVTDNYSRYLLGCDGFESPSCENTIKSFHKIFMENGLPDAIRTDNGQPFCGVGLGGLTRLSIWFLKLGIMPERISLGSPQENGRHERMHRTLKEATIISGQRTLKEQQKLFNNFITEFNTKRPHEGIQSKRPGEVYVKSKKQMPKRLPEVSYPQHFEIRRVKVNGEIKFANKRYFVSEHLHGEPIGLEMIDQARAIIYFARLKLGIIDARLNKILRPG